MNKNLYNPYAIILFFLLVHSIIAFSQTNNIVVGVDTNSIYITDIEDVHLVNDGNHPTSKWFDIDGNGVADIGIWVASGINTVSEYGKIILESNDDTYFSDIMSTSLVGPCDSLYPGMSRPIVKSYPKHSIFPEIDNTTNYTQSEVAFASYRKYFNPCSFVFNQYEWLDKESYFCFKKVIGVNNYYGWFKVEVLDYSEIIIKEFAANTNTWSDKSLFINEVMASNKTAIEDEYGEFDDWIEIYNYTDNNIWLGNFHLTDDPANPDKWLMPDTLLHAKAFILMWADNQQEQGPCHTNFTLDKDGGSIGIYTYAHHTKADEYEYNEQTSDISIGRSHDGGDEWIFFESPTPGASNQTTDINEQNEISNLLLFPNPANGSVVSLSSNINYKVYNIYGQIIGEGNNSNQINISGYNKGIYIVVSDEGAKQKLIVN